MTQIDDHLHMTEYANHIDLLFSKSVAPYLMAQSVQIAYDLIPNSWMRPPENNIIGTLPSCNDMPTGFAVWYMRPVAIVIRMPLSCNLCNTSFRIL